MKHPLVPSLEVMGTIALSDLSEQSFFGEQPKRRQPLDLHDDSPPSYEAPSAPRPILYVDRIPRQRHTDDCLISVGVIAAWRSHNGTSQGLFFETLEETREFARLVRRGLHTRATFIFRAASITKFNSTTLVDDRSIVVDAQLHNDRTGNSPEWGTPMHVDAIPHNGPSGGSSWI